MKISFIADVHVGNRRGGLISKGLNPLCQEILETLRLAVQKAGEVSELLVVAGDLLDGVRPEPQVVRAVQKIFEASVIPVFVLLGNHEMESNLSDDNSLAPLKPVVEVIEEPMIVFPDQEKTAELWLVPYLTGAASEVLPDALESLAQRRLAFLPMGDGGLRLRSQPFPPRVLVLHFGIWDASTHPKLRGADDAVSIDQLFYLCREYQIDWVLAGNWHARKAWEMFAAATGRVHRVMQVGALFPTGFSNPGVDEYGTLAVVDTARPERPASFYKIPGRRYVKASVAELRGILGATSSVFTKLEVKLNYTDPDELLEAIEIAHDHQSVVLTSEKDTSVTRGAVRLAVEAATDAAEGSALRAYVEEYRMPEGVDRNVVLKMCEDYLLEKPAREVVEVLKEDA